MAKLTLLAAVGLALGFFASADIKPAHACRCLGYVPWKLAFVDASADVNATQWRVEIFLNRSSDRQYSIHSNPDFELYMERP